MPSTGSSSSAQRQATPPPNRFYLTLDILQCSAKTLLPINVGHTVSTALLIESLQQPADCNGDASQVWMTTWLDSTTCRFWEKGVLRLLSQELPVGRYMHDLLGMMHSGFFYGVRITSVVHDMWHDFSFLPSTNDSGDSSEAKDFSFDVAVSCGYRQPSEAWHQQCGHPVGAGSVSNTPGLLPLSGLHHHLLCIPLTSYPMTFSLGT